MTNIIKFADIKKQLCHFKQGCRIFNRITVLYDLYDPILYLWLLCCTSGGNIFPVLHLSCPSWILKKCAGGIIIQLHILFLLQNLQNTHTSASPESDWSWPGCGAGSDLGMELGIFFRNSLLSSISFSNSSKCAPGLLSLPEPFCAASAASAGSRISLAESGSFL